MHGLIVRHAADPDATEAAAVIVRSITELCVDDHANDPEILAEWLANKTPDTVSLWINATGQRVFVATIGSRIVGVGAATETGEILLNYVLPDARFQNVSKSLLRTMEDYVREHGGSQATLVSTRTAHRFYHAAGFTDADPTSLQPGADLRMTKELTSGNVL